MKIEKIQKRATKFVTSCKVVTRSNQEVYSNFKCEITRTGNRSVCQNWLESCTEMFHKDEGLEASQPASSTSIRYDTVYIVDVSAHCDKSLTYLTLIATLTLTAWPSKPIQFIWPWYSIFVPDLFSIFLVTFWSYCDNRICTGTDRHTDGRTTRKHNTPPHLSVVES